MNRSDGGRAIVLGEPVRSRRWKVLIVSLLPLLLLGGSGLCQEGDPIWTPSTAQLAHWVHQGMDAAAQYVPLPDVPGVDRWVWCQQGGMPQVPGQTIRFVVTLTPEAVCTIAGWEAAQDQWLWERMNVDAKGVARSMAEEIRKGWRNDEVIFAVGFELPLEFIVLIPPEVEYAASAGGRWYSLDFCGPCNPRARTWLSLELRARGCVCSLPPCGAPASKHWGKREPLDWSQAEPCHDFDGAGRAFLETAGFEDSASDWEVWCLPGSMFLLAPRNSELQGRWYRHVRCPPAPLLEFGRATGRWATPAPPTNEWWNWPAPPWAAAYLLSQSLAVRAPLLYKPEQIEVRLLRLRRDAGEPSSELMQMVPAGTLVAPGHVRFTCCSVLNRGNYSTLDLPFGVNYR